MSLVNALLKRTARRVEPRLVAIRGAIDVARDTPEAIRTAVTHLVREIGARNDIDQSDIVSAQFTLTPDVVSAFPAESARAAGWSNVPMLCATAVAVPDSLPRCLRVLVLAYMPASTSVHHVYLGTAVNLRPDLGGPRDARG